MHFRNVNGLVLKVVCCQNAEATFERKQLHVSSTQCSTIRTLYRRETQARGRKYSAEHKFSLPKEICRTRGGMVDNM